MLELLVVMSVVAILALMAVPNLQEQTIRNQIAEALPLADLAKSPILATWANLQVLLPDNPSAGLPVADKIVNNFISALVVQNGAIHITFGNRVNRHIKGKILTLRPAIVEDAKIVPITWICGYAKAPDKMTLKGDNKTNIPTAYLPLSCRA